MTRAAGGLLMNVQGSDPGPFFLARYGFYVRELDAWIIILVFHGNDIHSGFQATMNEIICPKWLDSLGAAFDLAGEPNRLNIINYPNWCGSSRAGTMSISPPVHFGNGGAVVPFKNRQLNFAQHGAHLFKNEHARANRLGREGVMAFFNHLQYSNLTLNMDVSELLGRIGFTNEQGQSMGLDPLPAEIDIVNDPKRVALWRGYWAWHEAQSFLCLIRVRKIQYQRMQENLASGNLVQSFGIERSGIHVRTTDEHIFEGPTEHIIQRALAYKRIEGKVIHFTFATLLVPYAIEFQFRLFGLFSFRMKMSLGKLKRHLGLLLCLSVKFH